MKPRYSLERKPNARHVASPLLQDDPSDTQAGKTLEISRSSYKDEGKP